MKSGRRHSTLSFMVILALTVLVWGAVAMSEMREYPLKVRVEMTGFDRNRYAVLQTDSVVTLQVSSTGFNALLYSLKGDSLLLQLNVNGEEVRRYARHDERCWSVAVSDLGAPLATLLSDRGMSVVGSAKDSLRLVLAERTSKVLPVDISQVKTTFAEGYGLYGEPTVTPSTITLYGDEQALSKIDKVKVLPIEIKSLKENASFALPIDTCWQGDDIHASAGKVILRMEVEQFVERIYQLPITVEGIDSLTRINLYPDKVTLRAWIPRRDIASVTAARFALAVDGRDLSAHTSKLKVRLVRFPHNVRLHSLSPEEVGYVVIK